MVAALGRRFPGTPIVVADIGTPPTDVLAFWQGLPVRLQMLDVSDRQAVETLMVKVRPRLVVHAAAITPTMEQEAADPVRIVDVNLGGTLSLLDAATRSQCIERVLICSSAAVYGFGAHLPHRID